MATVAAAAAATCIRVRCDDGDGMFLVVGIVSLGEVFSRIANQWTWIQTTICANHSNPKPDFCPIPKPTAEKPTAPPTKPPKPARPPMKPKKPAHQKKGGKWGNNGGKGGKGGETGKGGKTTGKWLRNIEGHMMFGIVS